MKLKDAILLARKRYGYQSYYQRKTLLAMIQQSVDEPSAIAPMSSEIESKSD